jgi:O-antigen/teichoic acid export membrane protein
MTTTADGAAQLALQRRLGDALRFASQLARSAGFGKAAKGGAWTMSGYGVQMVLRFVSRILLAKLLINAAPIGQVAVVTTILAGLEMLTDMGINVNIVQHKEGDGARFLGTARTVQLLRSAGLFVAALAAAYPIAWIYHDRELAPLMMFASISVLSRGFSNPGMSVLVRQVDLKRPTIVNMLAEVTGFVVTVVWAIRAPSAWALVGGSVAGSTVSTIASQFAGQRTPFAWDKGFAKHIVHFGGWIILSTGTYFLASRGEVLILKGAVPDVIFGCFAFASMLVSSPLAAIFQIGSQVMFPFLADGTRSGEQATREQFRKVKWLFTALAILFAAGSILVSPWIIKLLHFNRSYAGLWWMVQGLGVRAAFDVFYLPTSYSILAAGASRYSAVNNLVRLLVLVSGLFVTVSVYKLGLPGAMWVLIGAPMVGYMAVLPGFSRQVPGALRTEFACLAAFLAATGAAIALAVALNHAGLLGTS